MSRRLLEVLCLIGAAGLAAITEATVPFAQLGPWAAGTLAPLVVIGVVICLLSWPPRFDGADPRPKWRLVYLTPLAVTAVLVPALIERPAGLAPALAIGLFALLSYTALLLGAVVFLVVLLPLGQLFGWWRARAEGRAVPAYVPLTAVLILSLAAMGIAAAAAFEGLPDGPLGLVFALFGLVGLRPDSVVVAHPAALLVGRIAALVVLATAVGFALAGRIRVEARR